MLFIKINAERAKRAFDSLSSKVQDTESEIEMLNNKLKFYSTNKTEFFKILKESIMNNVSDIDSAKCSLEDIFKGIEPGDID